MCTHKHGKICIYLYYGQQLHICIYTRVSLRCVYVCTVCMQVCVWTVCVCVWGDVYVHVHAHICVRVRVYACVCVCVGVRVCDIALGF